MDERRKKDNAETGGRPTPEERRLDALLAQLPRRRCPSQVRENVMATLRAEDTPDVRDIQREEPAPSNVGPGWLARHSRVLLQVAAAVAFVAIAIPVYFEVKPEIGVSVHEKAPAPQDDIATKGGTESALKSTNGVLPPTEESEATPAPTNGRKEKEGEATLFETMGELAVEEPEPQPIEGAATRSYTYREPESLPPESSTRAKGAGVDRDALESAGDSASESGESVSRGEGTPPAREELRRSYADASAQDVPAPGRPKPNEIAVPEMDASHSAEERQRGRGVDSTVPDQTAGKAGAPVRTPAATGGFRGRGSSLGQQQSIQPPPAAEPLDQERNGERFPFEAAFQEDAPANPSDSPAAPEPSQPQEQAGIRYSSPASGLVIAGPAAGRDSRRTDANGEIPQLRQWSVQRQNAEALLPVTADAARSSTTTEFFAERAATIDRAENLQQNAALGAFVRVADDEATTWATFAANAVASFNLVANRYGGEVLGADTIRLDPARARALLVECTIPPSNHDAFLDVVNNRRFGTAADDMALSLDGSSRRFGGAYFRGGEPTTPLVGVELKLYNGELGKGATGTLTADKKPLGYRVSEAQGGTAGAAEDGYFRFLSRARRAGVDMDADGHTDSAGSTQTLAYSYKSLPAPFVAGSVLSLNDAQPTSPPVDAESRLFFVLRPATPDAEIPTAQSAPTAEPAASQEVTP